MASINSANARMKSNINAMKNIAKYGSSVATGVVHKGLPTVARRMLTPALGPLGDVLGNASEANAMDDVQKIKDWKP